MESFAVAVVAAAAVDLKVDLPNHDSNWSSTKACLNFRGLRWRWGLRLTMMEEKPVGFETCLAGPQIACAYMDYAMACC